MFKTSIGLTPFTTDIANNYFKNITGDMFHGDNTFLSTLRALVAPRIKENERVNLRFGESEYNKNKLESTSAKAVVDLISKNYDLSASGQLIIHNLHSDQESNLMCLNILRENFCLFHDEYQYFDKIRAFYRKSFNVDCYINPDNKSVMVFVDNLNYTKLHYLQISILVFLPWYLSQEDGLTGDEMALIQSLRERTSTNYERCISKLAEQYDFRTARIRQLLSGFESRYEKIECEKIQREIEACDSRIAILNSQIGEHLSKRNDNCIRLLGLEQKIAQCGEESEIMEYFLCNKHLVLEQVSDRYMYFCAKDYLEYFDSEMAEQTINNELSFVYSNDGITRTGIDPEKMKKLLTEIFVSSNPKLKIRVCAAYRFDLNGCVSPNGGINFGYEFNGYLPNPHINNYNCMGNYTQTINQMLQNRDYIGAIEQCIASCKSLNWYDSTVMNTFMNYIWNISIKCIELPNGSVVNSKEAIDWLESQDGENNEQTEEVQTNE